MTNQTNTIATLINLGATQGAWTGDDAAQMRLGAFTFVVGTTSVVGIDSDGPTDMSFDECICAAEFLASADDAANRAQYHRDMA